MAQQPFTPILRSVLVQAARRGMTMKDVAAVAEMSTSAFNRVLRTSNFAQSELGALFKAGFLAYVPHELGYMMQEAGVRIQSELEILETFAAYKEINDYDLRALRYFLGQYLSQSFFLASSLAEVMLCQRVFELMIWSNRRMNGTWGKAGLEQPQLPLATRPTDAV